MTNLEEGQIVLCTVEKIVGTVVFVKIQDNSEGTIVTSEISPGRIRNLRDYVVPGKKIVCKILRIQNNQINLSLRRVKLSEKKDFLEKEKKEKNLKALLKTILKEKAPQIIEKISKENPDLLDFFENIKENPKFLEKYIPEQNAEKIIKILKEKKAKEIEIKKILFISSKESKGIVIIKKIIKESCEEINCEITYLAAGKYLLKIKDQNPKEAKINSQKIINNLEKLAKKHHCEFLIEKIK